MVVGESKRANIMEGIENTGDVRLHDHRLRLKQRFDIVRKLGQGTYGKVQLGINKKTGQEVAIKTIKKCKIESEADLIRIRREVQIMSSVRHPNIVHIYEVFENSEKMILVMEYCSGGELYDYLSQKKVFEEDEARRLFRQIATAVYYCHIHKICHRDLKLENVLLDDTGSAKIADFGLSNVFKETSLLSTFCGSPLYASPEIVKGTPYIGPEVDCWSLGVLLYTLVYGAMPFDGSNFKRLVRQISNGDYYEPKSPSSASPLIRDMLTVDPLKRADIAYICDHPWVNTGCETSCLDMAQALAAETPVRLDLLLSLAPAAPGHSNSVVVPSQPAEMGPEESLTDLTSSASMAVEPSNSAEKRILELVAEGGEDAIKPSPTRTIVSAGDNKRKLQASSSSLLDRKKDRLGSCANIAPPVPEEINSEMPPADDSMPTEPSTPPTTLKSSATITIQPSPPPAPTSAPIELVKDTTKEIKEPKVVNELPKETPKEDEVKEKTGAKPRVTAKKKITPAKSLEEKSPEKEEPKEEAKPSSVATAADRLTSLSLAQSAPSPAAPKPKKLSIPGGNVGSFKEQFERRASLTSPEAKRPAPKPAVSKIAKPKAQSEDRELPARTEGTVRLQQIGIEPSPAPAEEHHRGGVKKTESEPTHCTTTSDPSLLLQDARRSLQNSMAKLVEEKQGEDRRRAARDIISTAIRTGMSLSAERGKPPVPYGRSASAGVGSLASPPATPQPAAPAPATAPRVFRTEALHRVDDHRNRGTSVERIIPINLPAEEPLSPPPAAASASAPAPAKSSPAAAPAPPQPKATHTPLRRLVSNESSTSETCASPSGEPIKKSAREFIIPIAVEGKGYVTPRQRSLEPEAAASAGPRLVRAPKPRRISSIVSGGESEDEDDSHMHRLRSTRAARAESVSSGEEDEEDEGFHLLTAENLFSTLLHRVRALTNRLNGEEGPGFPQNPHSLFNNLQSPFFNSPHLPRRSLLREGWGSRDLHADFDSMFNKARAPLPRGNSKKGKQAKSQAGPCGGQEEAGQGQGEGLDLSDLDLSGISLSEREVRALSGLTPALSRRLQRQLLASLPPAAARELRRTLSLHAERSPRAASARREPARSQSATDNQPPLDAAAASAPPATAPAEPPVDNMSAPKIITEDVLKEEMELPAPQFCTLPRLKRHATRSGGSTPPTALAADAGEPTPPAQPQARDASHSRGSSVRSTPDRPLLSKYFTPERTVSLDESYSSDSNSILSEPSYIAAYGAPLAPLASSLGLRRHSMRVPGEQPRKRISRFLRSDFFDTPPDENIYAKHKKEKELETQKILKEIREKRNKSVESQSVKSPTEPAPPTYRDDGTYTRKCLSPISPISILTGKERSRSNTPFFPILDNIKENALDFSLSSTDTKRYTKSDEIKQKYQTEDTLEDTKLIRPKSYPVRDSFDEPSENASVDNTSNKENEVKEKSVPRESKLIRPKSYPTSSPSPEKVFINHNVKKDENKVPTQKEDTQSTESKADVEVSFSITLPKKNTKPLGAFKVDTIRKSKSLDKEDADLESCKKSTESNLVLKKYQVVSSNVEDKSEIKERKENGSALTNETTETTIKTDEAQTKATASANKSDETKVKPTDTDATEKKGTIKKKIIKKVTKSKAGAETTQEGADAKPTTEKKKVTKKVKKDDKSSEDGTKTTVKKKSMLQSIGHKLEKLASNKSSSPEKANESNVVAHESKTAKLNRTQREQSVPVNAEPPTESNLIKRAVTLTDVAALDSQITTPSKTTVSKVLGLFRKFEPKEKVSKQSSVEKSSSLNIQAAEENCKSELSSVSTIDLESDKPKRPTSLLLNGLGRKTKYGRTASDTVSNLENDDDTNKKENSKHIRNSLKLDFSRLPRVKKIVPTNPVIEPQIMNVSSDKDEKKDIERNGTLTEATLKSRDAADALSRSRSRSRSTFSNSEIKSDNSAEANKYLSLNDYSTHHPVRNHESTTPDKEDVVERIRRKSFYSRFNEKKQRRKSSLVGPGAAEYDPLARIHAPPEPRAAADASPLSPAHYDLSPGYSVASDLSPSTDRYRSLLTDLPSARSNLRFDNYGYGLNDKIDTYRSLDRNEFRKYPGGRSYLEYEQPSSLTSHSHRYARTKSLLDGGGAGDGLDEHGLSALRDPHKYNRTISMYAPGSYATYRPKRTLNSAIILKESEKEPSPENILEKIRNRKNFSISVTRKPDPEKEPLSRSDVPPQGQGDGAERAAKAD